MLGVDLSKCQNEKVGVDVVVNECRTYDFEFDDMRSGYGFEVHIEVSSMFHPVISSSTALFIVPTFNAVIR